jgi:hypothetical protein
MGATATSARLVAFAETRALQPGIAANCETPSRAVCVSHSTIFPTLTSVQASIIHHRPACHIPPACVHHSVQAPCPLRATRPQAPIRSSSASRCARRGRCSACRCVRALRFWRCATAGTRACACGLCVSGLRDGRVGRQLKRSIGSSDLHGHLYCIPSCT